MAYSKKPSKKIKDAEELTLAKTQWNAYTRARDHGHDEYIQIAKKCDAYYRGDQWDDFDMQSLDDQGRPALTINTILPTINAVLAEQSSKKADILAKHNLKEIYDIIGLKVLKDIKPGQIIKWKNISKIKKN